MKTLPVYTSREGKALQVHDGFEASTPLLSEDGANLTLQHRSTALRKVSEMAWATLVEGSEVQCTPGSTCQVSSRITSALIQAAKALTTDIYTAELVIEVYAHLCCIVIGAFYAAMLGWSARMTPFCHRCDDLARLLT
jgi:hypothetical protein